MGFPRPTRLQLVTRAQADLNSRLTGGDAQLAVATLKVLAFVNGGGVDGLYGYIDYLADQLLPDRCDEEWLARHTSLHNVPRKPAVPATGAITMTATSAASVDAGTVWQRQDGARFLTTSAVNLTGGTASVSVVAETAGVVGNTAAGTELRLVQTIEGLASIATVDVAGITDGVEQEDLEVWRARFIARLQEPPSGGTKEDYETWALEEPGVTRAWCSPGEMGPGTVTLRFVCDDNPNSIIPDDALIARVKARILALMPVTTELYVVAPVADPINFTIQNVQPSTDAVKLAIKAELKDLLRREAIPSGTILRSHMTASISTAAGEEDHTLILPAANVVNGIGRISTMGVVTWAP